MDEKALILRHYSLYWIVAHSYQIDLIDRKKFISLWGVVQDLMEILKESPWKTSEV